MRSKKQIIKIMISTLLLLSCMILFVGCGNSKPQSAANNSTDTPQNDNADSNANGSDNEPAQNTSKFTLKQVEFNASGGFRLMGLPSATLAWYKQPPAMRVCIKSYTKKSPIVLQ